MKVDFKKLDRAFNPKCIAIVGDKGESDYMWIRSQSNFKGKLYSVQIDPREIEGIEKLGVTNFTSIMDIPEPVDLAIVAVPREVAARVLDDLIRKDVAAAHFYTAGFSETGTPEGAEMERVLAEKAEQANFHLIGPNCIGLLNPGAGLGRPVGEPLDSGPGDVGFISQSGMHVVSFAREGYFQGLKLNKSVSYGNGTVLDSTDYLEYFGQDPEIKAIGLYVDGVKEGRRFMKVLREVAAAKPVVVWKGGRTDEGDRAVSSHSASLAVPQAMWEALVNQCGAINVRGMEGLIDTIKALLYFPPVRGDGVGVTGGSGGQSIAIADVFAEAGLRVPRLTQESYDEFATFFTLVGGGYLNPVDTANPNRSQMTRILEILGRDANIDSLVLLSNSRAGSSPRFDALTETLADVRDKNAKPVMVILSWSFSPEDVGQAGAIIRKLQEKGIPAFISLERCASALRKAFEYYHRRREETAVTG